jgi:hypothetical protein
MLRALGFRRKAHKLNLLFNMRYILDLAIWDSNINDGESLRITESLTITIPYL